MTKSVRDIRCKKNLCSAKKCTKFFQLYTNTPNSAKFGHAPTKMCKISAVENLCSWKSRLKFSKIGEDLLCTNAPHHSKFHCYQLNDVWEKPYKIFLHPSVLWRHLGPDVRQGPFYQPAKFHPILKTPLRDTCCQILSISWRAWLTRNCKRYSLCIPCGN